MWLSKKNELTKRGAMAPKAARLSRRTALSFLAVLPITACGFSPSLAPSGSLGRLRNRIRVADPQNRNDFVLKSHLEERLGQGNDFDLVIEITTDRSDVGITPDQVITRQQIDGRAEITLSDRANGRLLLTDTVTGFTSYGTTGTTASTAVARTAAFERLMVILGDRIVSRLAAMSDVPQ